MARVVLQLAVTHVCVSFLRLLEIFILRIRKSYKKIPDKDHFGWLVCVFFSEIAAVFQDLFLFYFFAFCQLFLLQCFPTKGSIGKFFRVSSCQNHQFLAYFCYTIKMIVKLLPYKVFGWQNFAYFSPPFLASEIKIISHFGSFFIFFEL